MTIQDIVPLVQDKLRGRSDLSVYGGTPGSDIPSWIYQAILDITPSYPFEELIIRGPYVNFVVGLAEYPVGFFLPNDQPPFTQVRSFFRFFNTTNPPLTGATNVVGNALKARNTFTVEPMSTIPGLPQYWCQNGAMLLFGFQPDQAYTVFMRYQRPHPFNLRDLPSSVVYMPEDWREIVAYAAAIKACDYLGMNDVGFGYYKLLHGDPKEPASVGLIQARQSQMRRNLSNNERQMQPIVRRYTG
jgi:hypothetical protein